MWIELYSELWNAWKQQAFGVVIMLAMQELLFSLTKQCFFDGTNL